MVSRSMTHYSSKLPPSESKIYHQIEFSLRLINRQATQMKKPKEVKVNATRTSAHS
jgi:hypothetical protein